MITVVSTGRCWLPFNGFTKSDRTAKRPMGTCPLDSANSTIGSRLTILARRFGNSSSKKALWQIHLKDRVQGGMRILRLAYWHAQTDRRIALGRADLQVRGSLHWKAFSPL